MTEAEYETKISKHLDDDEYEEAIQLCKELMEHYPKNATAHVRKMRIIIRKYKSRFNIVGSFR